MKIKKFCLVMILTIVGIFCISSTAVYAEPVEESSYTPDYNTSGGAEESAPQYDTPTENPYVEPTEPPFIEPTEAPYVEPTEPPYEEPTDVPTEAPTQTHAYSGDIVEETNPDYHSYNGEQYATEVPTEAYTDKPTQPRDTNSGDTSGNVALGIGLWVSIIVAVIIVVCIMVSTHRRKTR